LSVDKNERHRGNDEPDTPLLRELEGAGREGDVVIGSEQSDQGDHNSADGLDRALAIKAVGVYWRQVWRRSRSGIDLRHNPSPPSGTRIVRTYPKEGPTPRIRSCSQYSTVPADSRRARRLRSEALSGQLAQRDPGHGSGGQVRQSIKREEWPSRRSTAESEDRSSRCVPEV